MIVVDFSGPHCQSCLHPFTAGGRRRVARGLCHLCYRTNWERGTLFNWPAVNWRAAALAVEVEHLRGFGWSEVEVARRVGLRLRSLQRALQRAAAAGRAA